MRRIGLFGGTFDPPHVGHLVVAEWARERLGLERVVFMPVGSPPDKRRRDLSSVAHRVAMTRLAVRGHRGFTVSTLEARRAGPSYTVDTLRALHRRFPRTRLYLILGEDRLAGFDRWCEPEQIERLAMVAVAARPGARRERSAAPRRVRWLGNPPLAVSSSALRARARTGRSLRYLVPEPVERYLRRHRLYGVRA
jgi:nicotinate-nucleotide adenylyltransferase